MGLGTYPCLGSTFPADPDHRLGLTGSGANLLHHAGEGQGSPLQRAQGFQRPLVVGGQGTKPQRRPQQQGAPTAVPLSKTDDGCHRQPADAGSHQGRDPQPGGKNSCQPAETHQMERPVHPSGRWMGPCCRWNCSTVRRIINSS